MAVDTVDREAHLAVGQRDVERETVDRDLPAGLDQPPPTCTGLASRSAR
jgi:hypothetical protein